MTPMHRGIRDQMGREVAEGEASRVVMQTSATRERVHNIAQVSSNKHFMVKGFTKNEKFN